MKKSKWVLVTHCEKCEERLGAGSVAIPRDVARNSGLLLICYKCYKEAKKSEEE